MSTKSKVLSLDHVEQTCISARQNGTKIVLCHGVFDVLHSSHIDYLLKSKQHGDILVVSLTDDEYVNKGPNRPYFDIKQRCAVIASLSVVDYVIVSPEPSAVTVINSVKPNVYSKGIEYKNKEDITKKIELENKAVKDNGGETVYIETDEILSSSKIVNNKTLDSSLRDFISLFKKEHSSEEISKYIDDLRKTEIVLIGETIVDVYQFGSAINKSSKHPCMVFKENEDGAGLPITDSLRVYDGGILAVAKQLSLLVKKVHVVTCIGDDDFKPQEIYNNIEIHYIIKKGCPTTTKKRYIDFYYKSRLFETYSMNDRCLNVSETNQLNLILEKLSALPQIGIDYGHGFLSGNEKLFAINAQSNAGNKGFNYIHKYKNVKYMILDEQEMRLEMKDRKGSIKDLNFKFITNKEIEAVITTVGSKGCVWNTKKSYNEVPALKGSVKDTVGAGDAFFGMVSSLLYLGASLDLSCFLGNVAGYLVANTVGLGNTSYNSLYYKQTVNAFLK
tara:strand:- start:428 stop:1936 length:1509 start_codon:yes stop_codon:yes gene_type:complete